MNIKSIWNWIWNPPVDGPRATLTLRLMAGGVFLSEGILKFVYPNQGIGRFTKLGFAMPGPTAHFVAVFEIVGGSLLILGWLTRPVAIGFIIEMIVAVLSTKISLFLGKSPLPMPPSLPQTGIWAVLHESRSDYAQLLTSLFLLLDGPGVLSLDAKAAKEPARGHARWVATAALLLLTIGGAARAAETESAGISAPPAVADDFALGKKAADAKDYKTAEQFFQRALRHDAKNPEVLNMLAFSERQQGELTQAFEHYDQALALRPNFPEAHEYLAEAHLQAAMKELTTLRSYGAAGKEEADEVVDALKSSTKNL